MTTESITQETRSDRFRRLATSRVNRAINEIRKIGNLANRSSYEYSDDEIKKLIRTLRKEVKDLQDKFEGSDSTNGDFSF